MNALSQNSGQTFGGVWRFLGAVFLAALLAWVLTACDPKPAKPAPGAQSAVPLAVQGDLIKPTAPQKRADSEATASLPAPVAEVAKPPQLIVGPAALSPETSVLRPAAPHTPVPFGAALPATSAVAVVRTMVPSASTNTQPALAKAEADFSMLGFDKLSAFNFEVSDDILQSGSTNAVQVAAKTAEQIPQSVRDYNNKRISLKGFMLPLKVEGGKVTEMLIMRDQSMCCYGSVPKINEWVSVRMVGAGVKPIMDQAVTLYGRLHVGEMRENGYLVGIYKMDGERLDGPAEN